MDKTDKDKVVGFLDGVHRAEVIATEESVRVVRVVGSEAVCIHGIGLKAQHRLHNVDKITTPKPACPVCFGYLGPDGVCSDAAGHELEAARFMATSTRINRAGRREWATRAKYLERKMRKATQ